MDASVRHVQGPDYAVLAGYFVLMLGIGLYFYRHMRGMKDYFSGGNRIPWWLSGVSFYMSTFSVAAFIFYPALCYRYGWVGITLLWVAVPATLFSVLLFAKKWRRARIDSPVEYLETRYSPLLRQVFVWQGVPVKVIDDAIKLVAIGTFISVGLGLDLTQCILGAGAILLIYTFLGGLWAVTVTDFVQFIVLSAAIVIVLPLSLARAGGLDAFISQAPEGFFRWTSPEYPWIYVVLLVLLYCLAWSSINWSLIQRYYCVPRESDALKVGYLVVGLYVIGPPLMFLPAMAAQQFLSDVPDREIYARLCTSLLPAGMLGLMIAAMFSATMSMLSSDYNVCASVLTNDVYRRIFRPKASSRELVGVGRLMTLAVGLIALAVALLMSAGTGERLFRTMVTLFSVATAPVAVPMILGLLSRKITSLGALTGFVCGLATGLGLFLLFYHGLPRDQPTRWLGVVWDPELEELLFGNMRLKMEVALFAANTLVTLIVTTGVTCWKPVDPVQKRRIDAFHERLATPVGTLPEDQAAPGDAAPAVSPFRVIGISTLAIGLMMIGVVPWATESLVFALDLGLGAALVVVGVWLTWRSKGHPATARG